MDTTKENALREQSVHFKTPSPDYSATLNIEPMFVSGFGQLHTNEPDAKKPNKKLTPYTTITLSSIRALVDNPQSVDKAEGQWLITSTLPCRTFATQEQSGEFGMLWADLDKEPKPLDEVDEVLQQAIIPHCDFELYTSRSAQKNKPKARILIPVNKPLCGGDYLLCQQVLNDKLEDWDLTPDRATERAGQLCYLPNRGDFYQSCSVRDGNCFDPLTEWALEIAAKRAAIAEHERVLHSEAQAAAIRREALKLDGDNPDLIDAFNAAYTVKDILVRAGYKQRGNTFRHPLSESGSYSASVKNGRVHSMSSNDPLYTGGGGVGAHDAFSAFCLLFAGGDQPAALKLAGEQWLSIGGESWNAVKQSDYTRRKATAESRDPSGSAGAGQTPGNRNGNVVVRLQNGADIEPEVIRWLWDGWLAKGKLHIMAGAPGTGKTTIALALAATISTGGRFPDGGKCEPGNVLVWSGEDDPKDTLMPRLLAMGADRNRIYFVHDAAINGKPVPFDPAKHFSAIAEAVTSVGDVKLIIVDPIVSATSGDSHKTAEVRRSLQPVVDLAVKLDAAIVGISHFTKGTQGGDPLERVTGSGAFGALPRVVMATAKVKDNSDANGVTHRILVRTKSNIGPDGGGYEYSLDQQAVSGYPNLFASCVLWGEQLDGTAKQLLATAEADTDPDEQSEHKSAEDWLHGLLNETNGMQAGAVIKTAKTNGFSERTIYRAKNRLRLVVKITGFGKDRASTWTLPVTAPPHK